jgi:hypothetical protein
MKFSAALHKAVTKHEGKYAGYEIFLLVYCNIGSGLSKKTGSLRHDAVQFTPAGPCALEHG